MKLSSHCTCEHTSCRYFLAFSPWFKKKTLTSGCINAEETMSKVVFIGMIAHRTQVIVWAFCTFPANPIDRLLPTSVAHGTVMFHASGSAVEYSQVISACTTVVCCSAIVPHNHNFLRRLKVSDRSNVSFTTVLFAPFPIWAPNSSSS